MTLADVTCGLPLAATAASNSFPDTHALATSGVSGSAAVLSDGWPAAGLVAEGWPEGAEPHPATRAADAATQNKGSSVHATVSTSS